MDSALNNNQKVYAFEANKNTKYICSCCREEVIFKSGAVKQAHFAHKSLSNCILSENESEEHKQIKQSIYFSLRKYSFIHNLEMEKYLDNCVADIYFEKSGKKYAVEVQLSVLTKEKIEERTLKYKEKGIYVIWVHSYNRFLNRVDLYDKSLSVKEWEKWLISMNLGHLYLWKKEDLLIPVTFSKIYKKGKIVKRKREISSKPLKSIAKNFFGIDKEKWEHLPSAKLMYFK